MGAAPRETAEQPANLPRALSEVNSGTSIQLIQARKPMPKYAPMTLLELTILVNYTGRIARNRIQTRKPIPKYATMTLSELNSLDLVHVWIARNRIQTRQLMPKYTTMTL